MLSFITWSVDPEIFSLGPFPIRYYSLLFVAAFAANIYIFNRFFKRDKLPIELLDTLIMWAFISTILGLRLGHCFFYEPAYYLAHPLEIILPVRFQPTFEWIGLQGLASHGAAIGVPLGLYLFCRKYKMRYLWLLDRIVIVVALTGFFIRLGNLMNSEVYGVQTSLPWGFIFEQRGEVVPKHPTQIYESLAYLVIFFVLMFIFQKKENLRNRGGFLFGLFLVLTFTFRFFVEFIKEVQVDFEQGMALDMGQLLSIPFVLLGVGLIAYSFKHEPSSKPFVGNASYPPAGAKKKKK
ncbi:MAG: prolipoprotein diacylglyceryl transferase [Prevotellaceae bacterium]|jgi:prolipoprotein diacylglyceryl transferase|nr:prolipoprotein diacylglyceryl transferase [Prevotellaceae bacterium]